MHTRFLARSEKRIHFIHFLVNETTQTIAATLEALGTHADMKTRRTSAYPPQITEKLDAMIAEHQALTWEAPTCGILQP
jgi:acyl-CoA thioester hydrolase